VTKSADIDQSAKRIAYTKYMNAGQICLATNHVIVEPEVHDEFVERLKAWFDVFFEKGEREGFCTIVNERNWERVDGLLSRTRGKIERGGKREKSDLWIEPTVVSGVDVNGMFS
jgi:aldehyde dehydrogenase (NAD+)